MSDDCQLNSQLQDYSARGSDEADVQVGLVVSETNGCVMVECADDQAAVVEFTGSGLMCDEAAPPLAGDDGSEATNWTRRPTTPRTTPRAVCWRRECVMSDCKLYKGSSLMAF